MRTAYFVAKLGTVSAAAETLGVHRATVIRHIDALERELGAKMFRRHSRGYSPTEIGRSLVHSAELIEDEAKRFIGRSKMMNSRLKGDLVIATSPPNNPPMFVAAVMAFRKQFVNVRVKHKIVTQPPKLERGEAHIYFHFGPKLEDPDYVLRPWMTFSGGVYAHKTYIEEHGNPQSFEEVRNHHFALLSEDNFSPPNDWIRKHIPPECIVFASNDRQTIWRAVQDGLAIGCIADHLAYTDPDIHPIGIVLPEIETVCWAITHVDTHRSPKVSAFFDCLKKFGLMGISEMDPEPDLMPKV